MWTVITLYRLYNDSMLCQEENKRQETLMEMFTVYSEWNTEVKKLN